MSKVLYYLLPYDPDSICAIRTNDDGTYSMKTWVGRFIDEYGPSKKRFDMRSFKPYVTTDDFNQLGRTIKKLKITNNSRV